MQSVYDARPPRLRMRMAGAAQGNLPRFLIVFMALILTAQICAAQGADSTILARVNGREIRGAEFIDRFSLTVYPQKSRLGNLASAKQQFLLSLIAEKLLADEARRRHIDQDPILRRKLAGAEAMFVRDKLYRDAVRAKVRFGDADLWKYYRKIRNEVEYQFLYGKRRSEMDNLRRLLDAGMGFDSLLAAQQGRDSAASAPVRRADEELLAAVQSLAPGEVSEVVAVSSGFYIVRRMPAMNEEQERAMFDQRKPEIARRYREELEVAAAKKFVRDLWKGKKSVIRKDLFSEIGLALKQHFTRLAKEQEGNLLSPGGDFFEDLRRRYEGREREAFYSIGKDTVSLREWLDRLEEQSIMLRRSDVASFPARYKSIVQDMIDQRLITREGYRRGLQNSPDVRGELLLWTENGLAQSLADDMAEQFIASDDSLWHYYLRNPRIFGPPLELKIVEILHAVPDTLERLRARIARGAPIRTLARDYSQRADARETEGEMGYFPITRYPEISRVALGMKIGELSPVVEHKEGYSIFTVADVRRKTDSTVSSIADIRSQIERRWKDGILQSRLSKLVYDLALKAQISVDQELLARTPATPAQMFTFRYLGFGGRIPAVPSVAPLAGPVWEALSRAGKINF